MDGFEESKDYKSIHLEWIKSNRAFRPKLGIPLNYSSYLDYMSEMYTQTIKNQKTAYLYLKDDYNWSKKSKTIKDEVAIMFGDKPDKSDNTFFITFNFDNQKFDSSLILKATNKTLDKSWIDGYYAVFEYHTENGNHPHLMMRLIVNKYNKKGKLLDKMFESPLAKYTGGKNFIDVRPYLKCHDDYLMLDKAVEKKEYLDKDVIWRRENNLPEYLEKKISI